MALLLKFGGVQLGTELYLQRPSVERLVAPIEDDGVGRDVALLTETAPNLIWRPTFILWHEESDNMAFVKWMLRMARLMRAGRHDVTVWDDSTLKLTYPRCAFLRFDRPMPPDAAQERFSASVAAHFITNEEPR